MSSFVFNKFKDRLMNGEVPSADTWTLIPVSEEFKNKFEFNDVRLDHYRSLSDFKDVSDRKYEGKVFDYVGTEIGEIHKGQVRNVDVSATDFSLKGTGLMDGCRITHTWTKVEDDEDFKNKPMFITKENYTDFLVFYSDTIKGNEHINEYLESKFGGFYFIRSKEELEWFANRSLNNNRIIGVIGDSIDGVIAKPIGTEEVPFNGILDGNYFSFDITIKAENTDNGIVGVLGEFGIVRNFKLVHKESKINVNSIDCNIPITLNHIKKDGRDINCGLLVGRNYGLIENIDAKELQTFNLSGFVPSVYSVTNKSDDYKWNETVKVVRKKFDTKNENFYFLNSFCINSPGNICPYVGYFAEGKFADDAAFACIDVSSNPTESACIYEQHSAYYEKYDGVNSFIDANNGNLNYKPLGLYTRDISGYYVINPVNNEKIWIETTANDLQFVSDGELSSVNYYVKSPLYYGVDNFGNYTTRLIGPYSANRQKMNETVICYNNNLIKRDFPESAWNYAFSPSYEMTRCSMRMHPQARAAYNVGIIIGANFGSAKNIQISAVVKNTSNFVGFIGGLAGLQADGYVNAVSISMDNQFVYDFSGSYSAGDVAIYKNTPILPEIIKQEIDKTAPDDLNNKDSLMSAYCSAWYDEGTLYVEDNAVNTAENVTNDCVTYKLRPIFIVGGLFGRYVPTFKVIDENTNKKCIVDNVEVIYNDNYMNDTNEVKRMENAFGTFIGKVDYDSITNSIFYDTRLSCKNSYFSAASTVGEPFQIIPSQLNAFNELVPVAIPIEENKFTITPELIYKKLVGVYELKYNVLPSMTYNAYNSAIDITGTPIKTQQLGIYNRGDYPIDLLNHNDGIIQTHILSNYVNSSMEGMTYTAIIPPGINRTGPYDHWHQYFNYPTIGPFVTAADGTINGGIPGWNKRNMARELISLENCYSNNNSYIQLYDDYFSTWNINKFPFDEYSSKSAFTEDELYIIIKYWNLYRTNYNGAKTSISSNCNWDLAHSALWSGASAAFNRGLDQKHNGLNTYVMNGTQNTFDGYTTIDMKKQAWYGINEHETNIFGDVFSVFNKNESGVLNENQVNTIIYHTDIENSGSTILYYSSPREFKKNIIADNNLNFVTQPLPENLDFDRIQESEWPSRDITDMYYYYTYNDTEGPVNSASKNFNNLENVFALKYDVHFDTMNTKFGYFTPYTKYNEKINLGDYLEPSAIRNEISHSPLVDENNHQYITTSSVSASNNFGGLLVVDSSGNNVMFYDNENHVQLTGNPVSFQTVLKEDTNEKCILQVE